MADPRVERVTESGPTIPEVWPKPMRTEAYPGVVGDITRDVSQVSEADPGTTVSPEP